MLGVCNNTIYDNCNGIMDTDAIYYTWYHDFDFDGYGDPLDSVSSCEKPSDYVFDNTDCNDNNYDVYPGATEYCDYIDNDCVGQIDEGVFYAEWPVSNYDEYRNSLASAFIIFSASMALHGSLDYIDCCDLNH